MLTLNLKNVRKLTIDVIPTDIEEFYNAIADQVGIERSKLNEEKIYVSDDIKVKLQDDVYNKFKLDNKYSEPLNSLAAYMFLRHEYRLYPNFELSMCLEPNTILYKE